MSRDLFTTITLAFFCLGILPAGAQNCTLTADAGPDQTICAPGASITLSGSASEDVFEVSWTPAALFADPTALNTTAVINASTTLSLRVRSFSEENLIVNGNFEQGATGFSSEYLPGTGGSNGPLSSEGTYAVAANANDVHNNFADCPGHLDGGNMLIVNGAGSPTEVWCQTIFVDPATDYAFSAWVTTVVLQSPARLQFSINGVLLGDIFEAPFALCEWVQFYDLWHSGPATSAEICIVNQNTTSAGNDFALDDLVFTPVCEATDELTVTLAELSAAWQTPGALCENDDPVDPDDWLTAGATPGGNWTINGSPLTQIDPDALGPGDYLLRYTVTQEDCSVFEEQTLSVLPPPEAGFIASPVNACINQPVTFTYTGNAGPGATFDWNFGSGTVLTGAGAGPYQVQWDTPGNHPVSLLVTENGCSGGPSALTINTGAPLTMSSVDCQPGLTTLTLTWTPVAGAANYTILDTQGNEIGMTSDSIFTLENLASNTAVSLEVRPNPLTPGPCSLLVPYPVACTTNNCPAPVFSLSGNFTQCAGETTTLTFSAESESEGPYRLEYTDGIENYVLEPVSNGDLLIFSPPVSTTYTFTQITDLAFPDCSLTPPAPVTLQVSTPVADAGPDQTLGCALDLITIGSGNSSSGGGFTYNWASLDGTPPLDTDLALTEVEAPGRYVLTVTEVSTGCSARDTVLVTDERVTPQLFTTVVAPPCPSEATGLIRVDSVSGGTGPYLFALNDGPLDEKTDFTGLAPGDYLLTVEDLNGCTGSSSLTVPQAPAAEAVLTAADESIRLGESTTLQLQIFPPDLQVDTILWSPLPPGCQGCLSAEVSPVRNTRYEVTVLYGAGCRMSATRQLIVDSEVRLFAPNAFSPNGDGINDHFTLYTGSEITLIRYLKIVDRWGGIVFENTDIRPNDPAVGWDGRRQGEESAPGTYVFYAEIERTDGSTEIVSGGVTLLR